jgi:integrin-linked kinase
MSPESKKANCLQTFNYLCIVYPTAICHKALTKKPEDVNKCAADIWSFAIVLFEMHAKQIPFAQYSPMQCGLMVIQRQL